MGNSASIVVMAVKTAKECLQHLFECFLCKVECWNSHLIAGSPKKRREEKNLNKNNVRSKGKLKCRNSAGLIMLQVPNKVKNKLNQLKTIGNNLKPSKTN